MKVIHLHFKKSQYCAWYRMPLTCILETLGPAFLDIQKEYRGDESEYELCTEIGEKIIQRMRTASQLEIMKLKRNSVFRHMLQ